ncbi:MULTISPECIES: Bug family tripartite tricarboxylate transporter substrate binding protein [unclassified Variovorax]|uniref:Bug family tripartite tricarboxylate transporter substrate binding protein n=1 Tax=unclassified Variovorax TaxID=663243 RepID=UPI001316244E|nr:MULTISPECIES: tripartite tricarboxylate transporter substrate-binding protein [unclassified Variovorax]VTU45442.1 Argininosuccinate lyase [Variovorax sp. PBL-E5]VTU46455.1 Argininosuccinate lyase [Variovorax sp. SRS16]
MPRSSRAVHLLTRRLAFAALAGCSLLAAGLSAAQDYPANRPIRLIVGYPPGGSNDIVARIIAPALGEALGTAVVVENKAGVSGVIGADYVAKATPDGYVLLAASASPLVITPHTLAKVPFNTLTDLIAINTVGLTPEAIAVGPQVGVSDLKGLLALARTRQVNLASSGTGGLPHLTIELLIKAANGNIVHVPYKGAGPAAADAVAGHVDGIVMDVPPLYPLFQGGRLKPLAVTSSKRVEFLPDVPTAQEVLPGFDVSNWVGVFAPAKTPKAVIDKLNAALEKAVAQPNVRQQLLKVAVVPSSMASPAAFQTFVGQEYERWGKLVKEKGITTAD